MLSARPAKPSRFHKSIGFALALALGAVVTTSSGEASAAAEVSGTGKGIAGGALLGGEVGFLGLAAAGAQQSWLYYTLPPVLAIGGGVGGYFVEKSANADVPLYMLAGGMALVIPTVVITLSATSYRPTSEDSTPGDASPADGTVSVTVGGGSAGGSAGGGAGSSTTGPATGPAKHKPGKTSMTLPPTRSFALVSYDDTLGALRVGVPAVSFKPSYSTTELAKFGLAQRYALHAPIVDVTF